MAGRQEKWVLAGALVLDPEPRGLTRLDQRAARMEAAPGRDASRVGGLAAQDLWLHVGRLGDNRQERARVGVLRRREQLLRGRVLHDFRGAEKRRLRVDDLLARFEEVRRGEQLDESAAQMLRRSYV